MEPMEVIANPLELWLAPVGTAFPDVDEAPADPWFLVGTSGNRNYEEDGVTVTHEQTVTPWTPAGSTMARKVWRTEEGLMIGVSLTDLSSAQYAKALNDADVAQTAAGSGTPGFDAISLYQGIEVAAFALIARGLSSFDESMAAQYQVPRCYQSENPTPVFKKGQPAFLACKFTALYDEDSPDAPVGELVIQTAVAL